MLKIAFWWLSALLWLSFIFFGDDFQKVKNANLLVPDAQKSEISWKNHHKKNKRVQKVIADKVPIFVGGGSNFLPNSDFLRLRRAILGRTH